MDIKKDTTPQLGFGLNLSIPETGAHGAEAHEDCPNRETIDGLLHLLGPLVNELIRNSSGSLDPTRIKAKSFDEFRKFLIDQASIDDGIFFSTIRSNYSRMLGSDKFRPLLDLLYHKIDSSHKLDDSPEELAELLGSMTIKMIEIDADAFVANNLHSKCGRSFLGSVFKQFTDNSPMSAKFSRAIASAGRDVVDGKISDGVTNEISFWTYYIGNHTKDQVAGAENAAQRVLDSVGEIHSVVEGRRANYSPENIFDRSLLTALPSAGSPIRHAVTLGERELYIALARDGVGAADVVEQLKGHLATLWLWAADEANWNTLGLWGPDEIDYETRIVLREYVMVHASQLIEFAGGVRDGRDFEAFVEDVYEMLNGAWMPDNASFVEFIGDKGRNILIGNNLVHYLSEMPSPYRGPLDDILQFSDQYRHSISMGEEVFISRAHEVESFKNSNIAEPSKQLIRSLEKTKQLLWYGYKQHKAISRMFSEVAYYASVGGFHDPYMNPYIIEMNGLDKGPVPAGDIGDIECANEFMDGLIDDIVNANSQDDILNAIEKIYDELCERGLLNRAMIASENDGIEAMLGLAQTISEIIVPSLIPGAQSAAAARAMKLAEGLKRIGAGARTIGVATRAVGGMRLGLYVATAENVVSVATDEVRGAGQDTVLSWAKDAFATGTSMSMVGLMPVRLGLNHSLIRNTFNRYTSHRLMGFAHMAADAGAEAIEEIIDQQLRLSLDGSFQLMSQTDVWNTMAISAAGGGVKLDLIRQIIGQNGDLRIDGGNEPTSNKAEQQRGHLFKDGFKLMSRPNILNAMAISAAGLGLYFGDSLNLGSMAILAMGGGIKKTRSGGVKTKKTGRPSKKVINAQVAHFKKQSISTMDGIVQYLNDNEIKSDTTKVEIMKTFFYPHEGIGSYFHENTNLVNSLREISLLEIKDEKQRIALAKYFATHFADPISQYIRSFEIEDEGARIEIAEIAITQYRSAFAMSAHIQNYEIKDEKARIRIAKVSAAQNGSWTSEYIQNYGIKDQGALAKIAEIAAAQNGLWTSEYIQNYGIKDQEALARIAEIVAMHDGSVISQQIKSYGITDEVKLARIAEIAAAQDGGGTSQNIYRYGITDEVKLARIAEIAAAQDGGETSRYIKLYGIKDQKALIRIAEIAAVQNVRETSEYIQNYGIEDQGALARIAEVVAAQDAWGMSKYIKLYGIEGQEALIRIAEIAAAQDGGDISKNIKNYGIRDQGALIRIAEIAAAQDGVGTSRHIKNYGIKDRRARFKIFSIAILNNSEAIYHASNIDARFTTLPDEATREEIIKYARITLNKFKMDPGIADVLYSEVQRAGIGIILFVKLIVAHQNGFSISKETFNDFSRRILAKTVGIDPDLLVDAKFSRNDVGKMYELLFDIQALLKTPLFAGVDIDAAFLSNKKRSKKFLKLLHSLLLTLSLSKRKLFGDAVEHFRRVIAEGHDPIKNMKTLGNQPYWVMSRAPIVEGENIERIIKNLEVGAANIFRDVFKVKNESISISSIRKLESVWGNLNILYTLIGRFRANPFWKSEMPVLATVVNHVLKGNFHQYKYEGGPRNAKDREMAHSQLAMLSSKEALLGWRKNISRSRTIESKSKGKSTIDEAELLNKSKGVLTNQVIEHVDDFIESHKGRVDKNSIVLAEEFLKQGVKLKKILKEVTSDAVIRAGIKLLQTSGNSSEYKKILKVFTGNADTLGFTQQLKNDFRTLGDLMKVKRVKEKSAILFTTTTDDPKLLLMTGALADASSCQHYRSGSHAHTLLGYVIDAGVKVMVSYVITRRDFASEADFSKAMEYINRGDAPEFIAPKQELDIGGIRIKLPRAMRRRVVKLGKMKKGGAGLAMEKAYYQNHPLEDVMKEMENDVFEEQATGAGAKTGETITISKSRNPLGIYSDRAGGVQREKYILKRGN
jgi:hypothetical protein